MIDSYIKQSPDLNKPGVYYIEERAKEAERILF